MKTYHRLALSILPIAFIALLFQNCSQTESAGSASGGSNSPQQIDGDITIVSKPSDTTLYVGTQSFIAAMVRSERGFPLSYEWYKDGVKIDGADTNILELISVLQADAGKYELRIKNDVDSAVVEINVAISDSPVVQIRTQPLPLEIMNGRPGTLTVAAESSDSGVPIKYQWYRNGVKVPGAVTNTLALNSWTIPDSGLYSVNVSNALGVETIIKSNEVGVSVGFESSAVGCASYTLPTGVSRLKVTAIGGGGGGGRSYGYLAYNLLSGAGGAAVEAIATVAAGTTSATYCVGGGGAPDAGGGQSTFMTAITARGGAQGNGWHYKGEDGRGTPPSLGGTYTVDVNTVQLVRATNGQNVVSFGACGGNAGFSVDATRTGLGACSASENGRNFGGGGWGNGSYYSNGSPTSGAVGYIKITPAF